MEKVGKFTLYTLEECIEETYGKRGTPTREAFESGYLDFLRECEEQEAPTA